MKYFLGTTIKAIKHILERLRLRVSKYSGPGSSKIVHVILEENSGITDEGPLDVVDACQALQKKAKNQVIETLTGLDHILEDQPDVSLTVTVNGNRRQFVNAVESCIPAFKLIKFNRHLIFVEGITWDRYKCRPF